MRRKRLARLGGAPQVQNGAENASEAAAATTQQEEPKVEVKVSQQEEQEKMEVSPVKTNHQPEAVIKELIMSWSDES